MASSIVGGYLPFWSNRAVLIIGSITVMVGAVAAILLIQTYSAREYRTAVETDELALTAYELFTSGWRAVLAEQQAGPWTSPDDPNIERRQAREAHAAAHAHFEEERNEEWDGPARDRILAFTEIVDRAYHELEEGNVDQAFVTMNEATAEFFPLTTYVIEASEHSSDAATRAKGVAFYSTAGVGIGGFALIILLYWRYSLAKLRQQRTLLEAEILRRSESRFRPLVQSSSDFIGVVQPDGVLSYASARVREYIGVAPDEAVGRSILDFVSEEDRRVLQAQLQDTASRENYEASFEVELPAQGGRKPRPVQVGCSNFLDDPEIAGLVLNMRDITERKSLENQLRHQAFHDSLTGLSNRLRFVDRLEHALQMRREAHDFHCAVLFMDLDYFKNVNDEMGHLMGDELLKQVAKRVRRCVRSGDTAARLGGDEFAILLEEPRSVKEAEVVAERTLAEMKRPFEISGIQAHISASIGVVRIADQRIAAEEVMRNADIAMYDAKENGRGRVHVFVQEMQVSIVERLRLMREIEEAVEREEFEVYYQPTLDLATENVTGFEVLVRWNHPKHGLIEPEGFVSAAEETGAILGIGRLVLRDACKQARAWQEKFPDLRDFSISVNIATKQVLRSGFIESVQEALDESGLDPHCLVLEITEGTLLPNPDYVIDSLRRLRAIGVRVAIDDFGTGYSSLNYLKRFPIDILKVDRSFVEGVDRDEQDRLLIQTVMDLGHALNLSIVAEGIERREQLALLLALNCPSGQGYLFARPMEASSAEDLLDAQQRNLKEVSPSSGGKAAA